MPVDITQTLGVSSALLERDTRRLRDLWQCWGFTNSCSAWPLTQNIGHKMTCLEFIENLAELNEGENFPKEVLKALYLSIKTAPLEWAV